VIRRALRLAHRVVVLSEAGAVRLRPLAGRVPVVVVPNAVVTREFDRATSDRARFGIDPHRVALLFVGTRDRALDARKGLPHLIRAVAQVRRTHPELLLVLAGRAFEASELAAGLGEPGVGWISAGVVARADKAALFRSVDCFVLPSEVESMPNTVLEAMAAGLPIVATPVGAVPEMIADGQTGFLVPVGDVDALTAALARLVADPSLRGQTGTRAADAARRRYDFDALERRLAEEYASLDSAD
jgi:glycosyltransferase involved in cell wall biosynthesis